MADFTYTAKRNIKAGHSATTEYTITVVLQQLDDDQPRAVKQEAKALDGSQVTVLHRIERYLSIVTDYITTTGGTPDVDDFTEFFDSVAGGEVFTFDDGTARNARLVGNPTRTRNGLFFNYSFQIEMI